MTGASTIAILYFGVLLLLYLVTFFIGKYFFKFIHKFSFQGSFAAIFFHCLFGSIVLVGIVSLVVCRGKTINFIYLFLLFFFFIERRISKNSNTSENAPAFKINLTIILKVISICAAAFIWNSSVILKGGKFPIQEIEKDSFYYGEISKNLIQTGQENTFVTANLVNDAYHFPTPYHYFEMWLNGSVAKFFHLNYSLSLILVVYVFFMSLFSVGLLACIESFKKPKWKHVLLAFILIFVSGTYLTERGLNVTRYIAQMEGMGERYGGKLSPIYCLSLAFIYLFSITKTKRALLLLLLLPLFSISFTPAVLGGLFIYCIWQFFRDKSSRAFYLRMLQYTIITGTSIAGFYYLFYENNLNFRFDKHINEYTDLTEFSFFRIKFFLVELFLKVWAHPFLFLLNYFPFALLPTLLYFSKKIDPVNKKLLLLLLLIYFTGLIAYNTLYLMDDAFQLYINPLVILHTAFAFSLVILIPLQFKLKLPIAGIFIVALMYNMIQSWTSYQRIDYFDSALGEDYIVSVNKLIAEKNSKLKGGIFYDKKFYRNPLISYPLEYYSMPFILSSAIYTPFNLTSPEIEEQWNLSQMKKEISKSPFTQFFIKERKKDPNISVLQCQLDFIHQQKLNYLVIPKSDTVDYSKYLSFEKILIDKKSGQSFVLLK
jgi:hypothetical protein